MVRRQLKRKPKVPPVARRSGVAPHIVSARNQGIHGAESNGGFVTGTGFQSSQNEHVIFCKMFKKATGLNLTDYVSRVRIEKAKELLLNPNLRVSEIAYK